MKSHLGRRITAAALALTIAIGLSACATSDDDSGGDTIKVMVFGSFTQPPFPLPQIQTAAQAAVDRVNEEGGVDGVPLELIACDDQGNANGASACGRQAVEEDVVAVVGAFTLFGDAIMQFLVEAGIPYVLPNATSELEVQSEISFPLVGAIPPSVAALLSFDNQGCETTVLTAFENAQSQQSYDLFFNPVADRAGIDTAFVNYPPDTTDFTTVAARVADAGDCVVYSGGAADSAAIMLGLQQSGADILAQAALSTISMSETSLAELGPVTDGVQLFAPLLLPSTGEAAVTQAAEDMKAAGVQDVEAAGLNAYAAVLVVRDFAEGLDDVTAATLLQALQDPAATAETGIFPSTNFAEDAGYYPITPRVSGSYFYGYIADGGVWEPNPDADVDLAEADLG